MHLRCAAAVAGSMAMILGFQARAAVIYVDDTATAGANDGSSWEDAYIDLQDGLRAAASGDEVRVGQGTYRPAPARGDVNATFAIAGVVVRGGYAGTGAADPDANDPKAFVTTLSGDLNQNDPGPPEPIAHFTDNAHHVVTVSGSSSPTELAGFVITHGIALGFDAGGQGGGLLNIGGNLVISQCVIRENLATHGGGMFNRDGAAPTLIDCTFEGNRCETGAQGGAIYNINSQATMTGCQFIGNGDGTCGTTASYGGALYNEASEVFVSQCTFTGNRASSGGAVYTFKGRGGSYDDCHFEDNCAEGGGAMVNFTASPALTNCTFASNQAENGGAVRNFSGSEPLFTNCTFEGNVATLFGGGAMNNHSGNPTLINCSFRNNSAIGSSVVTGGAMRNVGDSNPTLINCEFFGNSAAFGGAMYSESGSIPALTNCTFAQNHANGGGPGGPGGPVGGALHGSGFIVSNSIVWGNTPRSIAGQATFSYSDVEGGSPGEGNIDADPMFVNQARGDLRLTPGSPCIDAANNAGVPPDIEVDLAGDDRFVDDPATEDTGVGAPPIVDMGALEFQPEVGGCPEDVDGNSTVNVGDLLAVISSWGPCGDPQNCPADITGDGAVNVQDLLAVISAWGPC